MTVEAESHFTSVFFLNNVFHGLLINRLRVTTSEAVVHVFFPGCGKITVTPSYKELFHMIEVVI